MKRINFLFLYYSLLNTCATAMELCLKAGKPYSQSEYHITRNADYAHQKLLSITEHWVKREKFFQKRGYISAYHGHASNLFPLQDFFKAAYFTKKLQKSIEWQYPLHESFIFLRDPECIIGGLETIQRPSYTNNLSDHDVALKSKLLSCSFSLFDAKPGESAQYFFEKNASHWDYVYNKKIYKIFHDYGFDKIYGQLDSKEGHFLQILIPEKIAFQCAYVSRSHGGPYKLNPTKNPFPHKNNDYPVEQFINDIRDGKNIEDVWQSDGPQLRIMLKSDYFANPNSGIKMFRYLTASEDKIHAFMKDREKLYQKLVEIIKKN